MLEAGLDGALAAEDCDSSEVQIYSRIVLEYGFPGTAMIDD